VLKKLIFLIFSSCLVFIGFQNCGDVRLLPSSVAESRNQISTTTTPDTDINGVVLPDITSTFYMNRMTIVPGGAGMGAYEMDPTVCNTTPSLRHSWQHSIPVSSDTVDLFAMPGDESFSYRFTTSLSADSEGGFTYIDNIKSGAAQAPVFMTITPTRCDFDANKVVLNVPPFSGNPCYRTNGGQGTITWKTNADINNSEDTFKCKLEKGKTYYFNLRFQDPQPLPLGDPTATSCPVGLCGGMISVR
jgi:hypothetical protein